MTKISIHALRGEGDCYCGNARITGIISIHALRGEGDAENWAEIDAPEISIHALRGEGDQGIPRYRSTITGDFNPRPPWGGRPTDLIPMIILPLFQSTPSVGRATLCPGKFVSTADISIHALRGEGDISGSLHSLSRQIDFNPRPPWGGRRRSRAINLAVRDFNPRPPWGGRRLSCDGQTDGNVISIHALRGEGDAGAD